jgi:hypothetical protein
MTTINVVSKSKIIMMIAAAMLSGTATFWGYVEWEALTDLPLYWRNTLILLPLLTHMGLMSLLATQARMEGGR